MTRLFALPISWFTAGHNDRQLQVTNVKTVGDGAEGLMIEHNIEAPSPSQAITRSTQNLAILDQESRQVLPDNLRRDIIYCYGSFAGPRTLYEELNLS